MNCHFIIQCLLAYLNSATVWHASCPWDIYKYSLQSCEIYCQMEIIHIAYYSVLQRGNAVESCVGCILSVACCVKSVIYNIITKLHCMGSVRDKQVLGRINCLLSFHYILNTQHDIGRTENTMSNSSSIVAHVFIAAGMCSLSRCLALAVNSSSIIQALLVIVMPCSMHGKAEKSHTFSQKI
jgi:hypothetical protein